MKAAENENFKNEISRRFYNYFYPKIQNKEIESDEFYESFGVNKYGNRTVFLHGLKYGHKSVTIDQVDIAYKKYGINPDYLFGLKEVATPDGDYVLSEASPKYGEEYRREVGRKLREILDKHKTNISQYAQERLGMTEQNLYKILRGQGRPYWDTVVTVCEDHGESLDLFRTKPLPKGHLLEQLASVKSENGALKSVNEILRDKVKDLETTK